MTEPRLESVRTVLVEAVARRVTPGGQLSVRWLRDGVWQSWDEEFGTLDYEPGSASVTVDTLYDLASVTKAVVALAFVRLASRGEAHLASTLGTVAAACASCPSADATFEQLLSHRAELPAWRPFYRSVAPERPAQGGTREGVLAAVRATEREASGSLARYSDVGYILLGEALAAVACNDLPSTLRREVAEPLGLAGVLQYRGVRDADASERIAPTERCAWRQRVMQGHVHDENAYALEGVSGHAGMFGTARAIAEVGRASLASLGGDATWFVPTWMARMVEGRPGGSHRLGWDGKSDEGSSAGVRMSRATFGHLGFTGTSLWCDPEANVAVALVTNRVHPTRDGAGIRELRIAVHDAVMHAVAPTAPYR